MQVINSLNGRRLLPVLLALLCMPLFAQERQLAEAFAGPSAFQQHRMLMELVGEADMDALDGYIQQAVELEDPQQQGAALEVIFTRYAELDPARAFNTALRSDLPNADVWVYGLAYLWAQSDLEAALGAARDLEGDRQRFAASGIVNSQLDKGEEFQRELLERIREFLPPAEPSEAPPAAPAEPAMETLWAEAMAVADAQARSQQVHRVASLWARRDPLAALEHIDTLPNSAERNALRSMTLSVAGREFPEEMVAIVDTLSNPQEQQNLLQAAFWVLAQRDGEHAFGLAQSLSTSELQAHAIRATLSGWAGSDPRAAAQAYGAMPDRSQFPASGSQAIGAYVRLDADEALAWAESLDGPGGFTWNSVIAQLASSEPEKAFEIISAIAEPTDQRKALELALKSLSATQPQLAIQFAELLPEGPLRAATIERAAIKWGYSDALAVMEWLAGQPEATQAVVMRGLAEPLARTDLGFAMSYPVELVPEAARRGWVATILGYVGREDPVAAHAWIREYRSLPEYPYWLRNLAGTWAETDPYAALELVNELPDDRERSRALSALVGRWAAADGPAAAGWLESPASGQNRSRLVQTLAFNWHQVHPSAARDWVTGLQSPDERNRGLLGLVNAVVPDAGLAEDYIQLMSGAESRFEAYSMLIHRMAEADPNVAQAYLDGLAIPSSDKSPLQQTIDEVRSRKRY